MVSIFLLTDIFEFVLKKKKKKRRGEMVSFDLVRPPSMEVLLVYGLAAWRNRGQMVPFRPWRRVPAATGS